MKLLLTSDGLTNETLKSEFLELIGKPAEKSKVIMVPTASRTERELHWVEVSKQELIDLGIKILDVLDLDHEAGSYNKIKDYDVLYMCGGNTFYLLHKIRETGFDKVIKQFLADNKLYLGVSAGTVVMGPNIEAAIPYDENVVNISDFTGLNIVDEIINPHHESKDEENTKRYEEKLHHKILRLNDNQALLIIDNEKKVIGD